MFSFFSAKNILKLCLLLVLTSCVGLGNGVGAIKDEFKTKVLGIEEQVVVDLGPRRRPIGNPGSPGFGMSSSSQQQNSQMAISQSYPVPYTNTQYNNIQNNNIPNVPSSFGSQNYQQMNVPVYRDNPALRNSQPSNQFPGGSFDFNSPQGINEFQGAAMGYMNDMNSSDPNFQKGSSFIGGAVNKFKETFSGLNSNQYVIEDDYLARSNYPKLYNIPESDRNYLQESEIHNNNINSLQMKQRRVNDFNNYIQNSTDNNSQNYQEMEHYRENLFYDRRPVEIPSQEEIEKIEKTSSLIQNYSYENRYNKRRNALR